MRFPAPFKMFLAWVLVAASAFATPAAPLHAAPDATKVCIQDEFPNQPALTGAEVWVNGTSGYGPAVYDPATGLACVSVPLKSGDQLVARKLVHQEPSTRPGHGWAWRAYRTSIDFASNGDPILYTVTNPGTTQVLKVYRARAVIGFNIVVTIDFDPTPQYLADLQEGFRRANDYYYRATDGQMFFEHVQFRTHAAPLTGDDYIFHADYTVWPGTQIWSNGAFQNHPDININFPRFFNGNSGLQGPYTDSNGYRTFVHEWGHLGLTIADEYKDENGKGGTANAMCTLQRNSWPWSQDAIASSVMDYQYTVSKFSSNFADNPHNAHDGQAGTSRAWYGINYSPWDMIKTFYSDTYSSGVFRDWFLLAPEDRTWTPTHVMPGPNALPVPGWASQGVTGGAGGCVVPITTPFPGTSVTLLDHTQNRYIEQGPTGMDGKLDLLGVHTGDEALLLKQEFPFLGSFWLVRLSLACATPIYRIDMVKAVNIASLDIAPCSGLDCLRVPIVLTRPVPIPPKVEYQLYDGTDNSRIRQAVPQRTQNPLLWEAYLPLPAGGLPRDKKLSGNVVLSLYDDAGRMDGMNMARFQVGWYGSGMDRTAQETDGPARGGAPSGIQAQAGDAAASDTLLVWQFGDQDLRWPLPGGYRPVGTAFRLNAAPGAQTAPAVLTIPWQGENMAGLLPGSVKLFFADYDQGAWRIVPATVSPEHNILTAETNLTGVFLLGALPARVSYLPLILNGSR